jgi:hypothetical protein
MIDKNYDTVMFEGLVIDVLLFVVSVFVVCALLVGMVFLYINFNPSLLFLV